MVTLSSSSSMSHLQARSDDWLQSSFLSSALPLHVYLSAVIPAMTQQLVAEWHALANEQNLN